MGFATRQEGAQTSTRSSAGPTVALECRSATDTGIRRSSGRGQRRAFETARGVVRAALGEGRRAARNGTIESSPSVRPMAGRRSPASTTSRSRIASAAIGRRSSSVRGPTSSSFETADRWSISVAAGASSSSCSVSRASRATASITIPRWFAAATSSASTSGVEMPSSICVRSLTTPSETSSPATSSSTSSLGTCRRCSSSATASSVLQDPTLRSTPRP